MKCSQEGLELIKKFEGCRLEAYRCSANVLTIGYGHTGGVLETDVITQDVKNQRNTAKKWSRAARRRKRR